MAALEIRRSSRLPTGATLEALGAIERLNLAAALGGDAGSALDELLVAIERTAIVWMASVLYDEDLISPLGPILIHIQAAAKEYGTLTQRQRGLLHDILAGLGCPVVEPGAEAAAQYLTLGLEGLIKLPARGRRVSEADLEREGLGLVALDARVTGRANAAAARQITRVIMQYTGNPGAAARQVRQKFAALTKQLAIESCFSTFEADGTERTILIRDCYSDLGFASALKVFSRAVLDGIPAALKWWSDDRVTRR